MMAIRLSARASGPAHAEGGFDVKTTARRTAILSGLALTMACVGIGAATVAQSADAPATVAKSAVAPVTGAHAASGAAQSGRPHTVQVAGRQIPVDIANGLYTMRGSLVGDWQYIPEEVLHNNATLYAEAGVEVFNGCIDRRPRDGECTGRDHRGELHLAFLYWARFDLDGNLIKGQCVHPITGGKGAFAGARGVLRMVDRPIGDRVRTTYRGHIRLDAVPTEGDAETPSASRTAATAAAQLSATSGRRAC
jgi:hypothetical protein